MSARGEEIKLKNNFARKHFYKMKKLIGWCTVLIKYAVHLSIRFVLYIIMFLYIIFYFGENVIEDILRLCSSLISPQTVL